MGYAKSQMKRSDKMMKKLAESSVTEGETIVFYDMGEISPASESVEKTKKDLRRLYTYAYTSAFRLGGDIARQSAGRYATDLFQAEHYVTVVTDRYIRIINARQTTGLSAKWVRLEDSEDMVLPLDQVKIQTGELSEGRMVMYGKWVSIPVTFLLPGDNSFTLHYWKEDEWLELEATLG